MKYKFNPFERAVGFFIVIALGGSLFIGATIAVKKNWFTEKVHFYTTTKSAANIRVGTNVLMSGVKVGKIEYVDLDEKDGIKVKFSVLKKYINHMKVGVKAQFVRPFLIGDKTLTLIPSEDTKLDLILANHFVPLNDTADIMDLISGSGIEKQLARIDTILQNVSEALVYGKDIALQVSDKKKVQILLENVTFASKQLKNAPQMVSDTKAILTNLNSLTEELKNLQPVLRQVAHKLPDGSEKTIKLIEESVTVLQAMQKNFFLRSGVEEVKKEREEQKLKERMPASEVQK